MRLLLLRHGHALSASNDGSDAKRSLSEQGYSQMQQVAKYDFSEIDLVLVSPYLRAQQSYQCLKSSLSVDAIQEPLLVPDADILALEDKLSRLVSQHVLLIAHNPLLSQLLFRLTLRQEFLFDTANLAILQGKHCLPACMDLLEFKQFNF